MANEEHPVYCGNCGSIVQAGDRFCGVCGATVPPDAQQATPPERIPTQVPPPPTIPSRRRNRKLISGVMVGVLLVVLLAGAGAIALTNLGSGTGLLGGAEEERTPAGTTDASKGSSESSTPSSTPSEPSWMSDEEIASLEEFGRKYDEAVRGEDWEKTYSMLDESSQEHFTEDEWTEKQQSLRDANGPTAPLDSITVEQDKEVTDVPVTVVLHYEDGTEETMRAGTPMAVEPGENSGPRRYLTKEEISELEQLSSAPSGSTTSPSYNQSTAEAEAAAGEYYRAVGVGDWGYTYDHLDSSTQSKFTRDEWYQKNEFLAGDGSTIYYIDSVQGLGGTSVPTVEVTVRLTFEDGSSTIRNTYFVYEDGSWKHRFGEEENNLLMPDASYEQFVEAQQ